MCLGGASRVTLMAFRADVLRVGRAESTAALKGVARQGCVERCARDCTDKVVSSGCVWAHLWAQTVYGGLALTDTG